ncbi:MAG: cell surface protein SprA [Prevotellaceae bacterium]|nr:cell surface protein SprA [Prevotellaceae bacterium]
MNKIVTTICILGCAAAFAGYAMPFVAGNFTENSQMQTQTQTAADNDTVVPNENAKKDTVAVSVRPLQMVDYQDLEKEYPFDLRTPDNVTTEVEFDYDNGNYIIHTKIGEEEIGTPVVMSADEYKEYSLQKDMQKYWREKNAEAAKNYEDKFNITDMKFSLGPADKLFGPGGVQIKTQGSAEITFGIKHNNVQNYQLSERLRKTTSFDFDEKIQLNMQASVGEKIKFNLNYDTESTFDFDRQNLRLGYDGKEDDWLKKIEAGNVSMNVNSALIPGSTSLFGIKTDMQFGKLSVSAVVSQQQSSSQNVNTNGGARTIDFEIPADQYDANRHYFLAQYFRDNYDKNMQQLPHSNSGTIINRIEVWITNKRGIYEQARNVIAFTDLGESTVLNDKSGVWTPTTQPYPRNAANDLYTKISGNSVLRNMQQFTSEMGSSYPGIVGGEDYEKIESARRLDPSEYTLNTTLGFISLRQSLNADEVLAVAFEYTIDGETFQVGEFSTNGIGNDSTTTNTGTNSPALIVKLIKSTAAANYGTLWKLMMKNVYSLGASSFQAENFKLNVMYKNDSTGVYLNYIPVGNIANKVLLKVMNLDRLDSYQNPRPDGKFDFVEGYTIISSMGRVIFPVLEPFGSHLHNAITGGLTDNDALNKLADKYVFQELYDSTMVSANEVSEKNKFKLSGSFQGTSNSEIYLNAMNVPRGSVTVTSGGITLVENVDYTVDYIMGVVTILNSSILASNTPVDVRLESRDMFNLQRKTLLGAHLEYAFNKDFTVGGTIMHLSEMPIVTKTMMGQEPISNTVWGLNMAYKKDMQWLTTALDKIPLLAVSAPSSITFNGEVAQMIPGHRKIKNNPGYAYIDDFEATETKIDLRYPYYWNLSSTPADAANGNNALFPEATLSNNIDYGKNRALISWYNVDNYTFNKGTNQTPGHLKNDKNSLSNHLTRAVKEKEIFPNRQPVMGAEAAYLPVLNLSYYPSERGPYNLDVIPDLPHFAGMGSDGKLLSPEKRWGGIMRRIESSDFEQSNIEYLEFWLMDPFVNDTLGTHEGGYLYFNLGDISEDILKDGKKFFENGMPANGDTTLTETTAWGRVPKQQSMVLAFASDANSRQFQDVGFNGLRTEDEFNFAPYQTYLQQINATIDGTTRARWENDPFSPLNDPAGDNYHYFRGSDYDEQEMSILERYKHYNGTEGNSAEADNNGQAYATAATSQPDVEDINHDNTLNEYEKYWQYKIEIKRGAAMEIGENHISDIRITDDIELANKTKSSVKWYQYKIPLASGEKIGGIRDFKSIRFMRIFLTGFKEPVTLRFGTMELVRGEWRKYTKEIIDPKEPPTSPSGTITVAAVNYEENSKKQPVNYLLPPGVTRENDPSQPQMRQQNEQAMMLRVSNLAPKGARGVYKKIKYDLRQFRRLQMFAHAENFEGSTDLEDTELSVFLRIGSDHTNNYYEYEIPLKLTPQGYYTDAGGGREQVWPSENMFDFPLELFTELKKQRNTARNNSQSGVSLLTAHSMRDPEKPQNKVTIMGNPNLGEIETMMIGVRNTNGQTLKSGEIWVNELRLTDYNEDGGWGTLGNVVLALSDFANVNVSGRYETTGFGGIEQNLNSRRLDDYYQVSVATQAQLGKFFPEKAKINLPIYYSYSIENSKPKYSPLDGDMLLKDALEEYKEQEQKDSILLLSQTRTVTESFNVTGVKVDIRGKRPHFYDPANLSLSYAYQKSQMLDPETERNHNISHQGSINYDFNTSPQVWEPFKNSKSKNFNKPIFKLIKDFGIYYSPKRVALAVNVARLYSETQLRDLEGSMGIDPHEWTNALFSSSKNFTWNRTFNFGYDLTKNLQFNFNTATNSRIDETMYSPVNKSFFPTVYDNWRDTVLQSLKHLGTPLMYQQTFSATYKVPLDKIPFLDWLSANANYTANYNWDYGAISQQSDINYGNIITNSSSYQLDGRVEFEKLYNKSKYLKSVNQKYQSRSGTRSRFTPKTIEKKIIIPKDTSINVKHALNSTTLDILAKDKKGKKVKISFKTVDKNTISISSKSTDSLTLSITTRDPNSMQKIDGKEVLAFSTRFLMMVRNVSVAYRESSGLTLPGFRAEPYLFGQRNMGNGISPGLDFAFGMPKEDYIYKAQSKGWLIGNDNTAAINPAALNVLKNIDIKANVEPISGLKINLSAQSNATDSRTMQFLNDFDKTKRTTTFSGTFQMTSIAIGTAFWTKRVEVGNERSYDLFKSYRAVIADRLQQKYEGTIYPNSGFLAQNGNGNNTYNPANGKFSSKSTDVMIPAFFAAYSGRDINKTSTNIIPSLLSLLPNWTISYDGLTRLPFIQKHLKSVTLNHAYQSSYGISSYTSYANFVEIDKNMGFINDVTNESNAIPSSGYDIAAVQIQENFAPFIGVDIAFKNSLTGTLKYNRSRTISLQMTSVQIAENYTNEIVIGVGYIIKDFDVLIKLKSNRIKRVKNDLTTRLDFSFKDMSMLLRTIDANEPPQANSGNKTLSVRFTADYVFSSKLNFRFFFNYQSNKPLITTSYPISTVDAGLSIKFLLTR